MIEVFFANFFLQKYKNNCWNNLYHKKSDCLKRKPNSPSLRHLLCVSFPPSRLLHSLPPPSLHFLVLYPPPVPPWKNMECYSFKHGTLSHPPSLLPSFLSFFIIPPSFHSSFIPFFLLLFVHYSNLIPSSFISFFLHIFLTSLFTLFLPYSFFLYFFLSSFLSYFSLYIIPTLFLILSFLSFFFSFLLLFVHYSNLVPYSFIYLFLPFFLTSLCALFPPCSLSLPFLFLSSILLLIHFNFPSCFLFFLSSRGTLSHPYFIISFFLPFSLSYLGTLSFTVYLTLNYFFPLFFFLLLIFLFNLSLLFILVSLLPFYPPPSS